MCKTAAHRDCSKLLLQYCCATTMYAAPTRALAPPKSKIMFVLVELWRGGGCASQSLRIRCKKKGKHTSLFPREGALLGDTRLLLAVAVESNTQIDYSSNCCIFQYLWYGSSLGPVCMWYVHMIQGTYVYSFIYRNTAVPITAHGERSKSRQSLERFYRNVYIYIYIHENVSSAGQYANYLVKY